MSSKKMAAEQTCENPSWAKQLSNTLKHLSLNRLQRMWRNEYILMMASMGWNDGHLNKYYWRTEVQAEVQKKNGIH